MPQNKTVFVSSTVDVELRPPQGGRDSLFIQNQSGDSIYFNEGSQAVAEQSVEIGGGLFYQTDLNQGKNVPQGNCWLRGSTAALQRVLVKD